MREAKILEKLEFLKTLLADAKKELPSFIAHRMWADRYFALFCMTVVPLFIMLVLQPLAILFGSHLSMTGQMVFAAFVGAFGSPVFRRLVASLAPSTSSAVHRIPGWRFGRILHFIYGPRIYARVIEPQMSDHQIEYVEAIANGKIAHARYIWLRCCLSLSFSAVMQLPISLTRICAELWRMTAR
jgi:hypothetical protein